MFVLDATMVKLARAVGLKVQISLEGMSTEVAQEERKAAARG